MLRSVAVLAVLLLLAACGGEAAPIGPPEGWTASGDRWWAPGADTSAAFRDLTSFETMGVEPAPDAYDRWIQEQLLPIYRSNPEVADSVFTAGFAPELSPPDGTTDFQAAAATAANDVKRDFYQRFNGSRKVPGAGIVVPDSLAGVSGEVVLQVYVAPDKQPLAVELLAGTGTALDRMAMREAALSEYTDGWVRPTRGQSAGVTIPTWVRVTQRFGGQ